MLCYTASWMCTTGKRNELRGNDEVKEVGAERQKRRFGTSGRNERSALRRAPTS